MWKILLALALLSPLAFAEQRSAMVFGNNNNALYLPSNKPLSGTACLVVDPLGVVSPQTCGGGGGGSGTVTSVDWGSLPSWMVGLGGPITTSGSLGLATPSQAANKFLASPSGSAGVPSFRSITALDIPTLNQNTTGSAGSLSSTFGLGLPLFGNANGTPVTGTKTGTTTKVATAIGTWTAGHGVKIDVNGDLIDTGVLVDQASGPIGAVQFKSTDGVFKGVPSFKFNESNQGLYVNDVYLAQGMDHPAGFTHDNKIEPWDRTGNKKVLVNTDGNPTQPGKCYVFDAQGNFVSSGASCLPLPVDQPVEITGDYTVPYTNVFILANCAALCTVTMPDISAVDGYKLYVKNIGTADVILHNMAGQKIDGQDDWELIPDMQQINLISSGGQWYVY